MSIVPLFSCLVALSLMPGCGPGQQSLGGAQAGLTCIEDNPDCIDKRQSALRMLVADQNRTWVQQPASPEVYASGVRLFAYKHKKKDLTCAELAIGVREAKGARQSLRSAESRLNTAQIARGALLADEVSRELTRELNQRCEKS